MAPLTGKVAIVTGASSGIGLAVAKQLAVAGASVAITARSEDKLSEVKSDIEKDGGKAVTIQCDVTNRQEVSCTMNSKYLAVRNELTGADPVSEGFGACTNIE